MERARAGRAASAGRLEADGHRGGWRWLRGRGRVRGLVEVEDVDALRGGAEAGGGEAPGATAEGALEGGLGARKARKSGDDDVVCGGLTVVDVDGGLL